MENPDSLNPSSQPRLTRLECADAVVWFAYAGILIAAAADGFYRQANPYAVGGGGIALAIAVPLASLQAAAIRSKRPIWARRLANLQQTLAAILLFAFVSNVGEAILKKTQFRLAGAIALMFVLVIGIHSLFSGVMNRRRSQRLEDRNMQGTSIN